MKIKILYKFQDGPWGGGNQFLKALKQEFLKNGVYENNPAFADVILFNSHQNIKNVLKLKRKFSGKIFVHRIDGPIFLIRNTDLEIDKLVFRLSENLADFTIFQSQWSMEKCKKLGFNSKNFAVIYNAPDSAIFNANGKNNFSRDRKTKLIANSWSRNWNKGFEFYKFLDENLDFSKYEFTFIGNSPIQFKNIKQIDPAPSLELAEKLRNSDIFLTASKNDPCSNSLIEALSTGLPALALDSGGHPELIKNGGEVFSDNKELLEKLEKIRNNYEYYQSNIPRYSIDEVAEQYEKCLAKIDGNKKFTYLTYFKLYLNVYAIRLKNIKSFVILKFKNFLIIK